MSDQEERAKEGKEQQEEERAPEQEELKDLDVPEEGGEQVRGGARGTACQPRPTMACE